MFKRDWVTIEIEKYDYCPKGMRVNEMPVQPRVHPCIKSYKNPSDVLPFLCENRKMTSPVVNDKVTFWNRYSPLVVTVRALEPVKYVGEFLLQLSVANGFLGSSLSKFYSVRIS